MLLGSASCTTTLLVNNIPTMLWYNILSNETSKVTGLESKAWDLVTRLFVLDHNIVGKIVEIYLATKCHR